MARERTFAERLSALIEAARVDGRAPHSYREISAAIERAGGPQMSPAYIQQLAAGKRVNPKIHYVEALAKLFGVPVTYFFDEEVAAPPAGEAQLMALRAQELSPQGRRQVMDLLELVERYERAEREGRNPEDGEGRGPGSNTAR